MISEDQALPFPLIKKYTVVSAVLRIRIHKNPQHLGCAIRIRDPDPTYYRLNYFLKLLTSTTSVSTKKRGQQYTKASQKCTGKRNLT
jgi:hypothetical protein